LLVCCPCLLFSTEGGKLLLRLSRDWLKKMAQAANILQGLVLPCVGKLRHIAIRDVHICSEALYS
jgi:hypothetical protein